MSLQHTTENTEQAVMTQKRARKIIQSKHGEMTVVANRCGVTCRHVKDVLEGNRTSRRVLLEALKRAVELQAETEAEKRELENICA